MIKPGYSVQGDCSMEYIYMMTSKQLFFKNVSLANSLKSLVDYGFMFRDKYFRAH